MDTQGAKPFKIGKQHGQFKGIVARNLKELKEKSLNSLKLEVAMEDIEITLDEDGTLIDDEDYFATLTENTKLVVTCLNVKSDVGIDVTDGSNQFRGKESEISSSQTLPIHIKNKLYLKDLSECIIAFVTMSNEELDLFLNCDLLSVTKELHLDKDVANVYIDNAVKELSRREELTRATELIKLYESAKEKSSSSGEAKRKRPLHT